MKYFNIKKCANSNYFAEIKDDFGLTKQVLLDSAYNEIGEIVSLHNSHDYIVIQNSEGLGLINKEGDIILDCCYSFLHNRCGVHFTFNFLAISKKGCYGLMNKCGKIILPCKYPGFANFNEVHNLMLIERGYIPIRFEKELGLVNLENPHNYLLNCIYNRIYFHSNNAHIWLGDIYGNDDQIYIIAESKNNTKIINTTNDSVLFDFDFQCSVLIIYNHTIIISTPSNKIRVYSIETKEFYEYDDLATMEGQYIQIQRNGYWGIFDLMLCQEAIPCKYFPIDEIEWRSHSHFCPNFMIKPNEDLVLVSSKGLWGYINLENKLVVDYHFEKARPFSEGLAAVYIDFYWRFIDKDGVFVGGKYDEVKDFKEGFAAVKQYIQWGDKWEYKWGYIDKKGNQVIPFRFNDANSFSEGLAPVAFRIKWGYINQHNQTIIPFRYRWAYQFINGVASVNDYGGNGHIDKFGNWIDYEEYNNNSNSINYEEDTWYALTDGMYGDFPGDTDYDLFGF